MIFWKEELNSKSLELPLIFVVVVQLLSHVQLRDAMDCNMSVFPVFHYLPEFAQTHIHWDSLICIIIFKRGENEIKYPWEISEINAEIKDCKDAGLIIYTSYLFIFCLCKVNQVVEDDYYYILSMELTLIPIIVLR